MASAVWWLVFLLPAAGLLLSWHKLVRRSSEKDRSIAGLICLTFTSAATALALWAFAEVQLVGPFAPLDYTVEQLGLLFSFAGLIAGLVIRRPRPTYTPLALSVSIWMTILFFLMASTY